MPSSVLHPSLCLFFIDPIPMLSYCVSRKSASCLSIWTATYTRVATLSQANRPSQISRGVCVRVQLVRPSIDFVSFPSLCVACVFVLACRMRSHRLVRRSMGVRLRLYICASSRHLFAVGSAARSPGFCLPPRAEEGSRKQIRRRSLFPHPPSLTRRPQCTLFISSTRMPQVIFGEGCF